MRAYGVRGFINEPGAWAIVVLRFGQWGNELQGPLRMVVTVIYSVLYSITRLITGIDIPRSVVVGEGLRIFHFGGVNFAPNVVIGKRCRMRQGITVGLLTESGPAPVVGDDVFIGAYAQILGPITIGDGAKIGAMSVVLQDVPPGATAVGIPARILSAPKSNSNSSVK